jgi:hypothetical protein
VTIKMTEWYNSFRQHPDHWTINRPIKLLRRRHHHYHYVWPIAKKGIPHPFFNVSAHALSLDSFCCEIVFMRAETMDPLPDRCTYKWSSIALIESVFFLVSIDNMIHIPVVTMEINSDVYPQQRSIIDNYRIFRRRIPPARLSILKPHLILLNRRRQ